MTRPVHNPPNPFRLAEIEWDGPPPPADLEVHEERAKSILSKNESPDLGFEYSVNPYRGCFHACAYCYARPSHQYLDLGAGTDFDRRLVVKTNAVELLRRAFERRSWSGGTIAFSGNTDCYQPLEASYELTRGLLELCAEHRNPVAVITKSKLVRRDADLLARIAREAAASVAISIPFASDADARAIEPYASPPSKRFETLRILSEAGIPTTLALAPVIPGLNDDQIPEILERAKGAGASRAFHVLLRLPREVGPIFERRLRETFPLRADKVLNQLRSMRGGELNDPRFGSRMRGSGPRYELIERLFDLHARRLGLDSRGEAIIGDEVVASTFRRPRAQLELFE